MKTDSAMREALANICDLGDTLAKRMDRLAKERRPPEGTDLNAAIALVLSILDARQSFLNPED